jgi:hypothetical protein
LGRAGKASCGRRGDVGLGSVWQGRRGKAWYGRAWHGRAWHGKAGHGKHKKRRCISLIYKWKQNRFPVDAQTAGKELERIQSKYNGILPSAVVEESRPEEAVLHNCFNWNDADAAGKYREIQAKEIIRNIVVVKVDEVEKDIVPVRAFVSVVNEDEERPKYISINKAMSEPDYQEQILQTALKELLAFKQKYQRLLQFKKVFDAIDEVQAELAM